MMKQFKADYVWVCGGNPKQEILANQLYKEFKAFCFDVGAAIDFVLDKKRKALIIFRNMGLEWFYRLIIDFKYSKKKVWKSLIMSKYVRDIKWFEDISRKVY